MHLRGRPQRPCLPLCRTPRTVSRSNASAREPRPDLDHDRDTRQPRPTPGRQPGIGGLVSSLPFPGRFGPLLAGAAEGFYRAFLMTAVSTGARHDELLALRWEDVDLDAGTLHLRRRDRSGPGRSRRGACAACARLPVVRKTSAAGRVERWAIDHPRANRHRRRGSRPEYRERASDVLTSQATPPPPCSCRGCPRATSRGVPRSTPAPARVHKPAEGSRWV